ncbi:uncharacterized protein LOC111519720 isoform X2 [Drosophila willistoni]|uniref:uncharacterized protein LOC111519720 isoform X2 n=1 Tax=Drosophila willistoni TaxID=7260 RepID=UPI001F07CE67|nr:uncharacterized protein LOC111519720 isoform X2 [Drosophila willistoni]
MFPRRPTKHPVLPAKQPVAPTIEDIKKYIKSLHPYKFFHKDYVRKIAEVQNLMLLKPKKGNQKKGNQKKGLARSLMSDKSRKNFDIMMLNRFGHMKK